MIGLAARLLGGLEYQTARLAARDRLRLAAAALARALPDSSPAQRQDVLRRSFELRARRRLDGWRALDDRALCRRLTLEGFAHLHAAGPKVLWVTADLGEPRLAERVLRLYGGDPQAPLHSLSVPGEANGGGPAVFLGQSVRCSTELAETARRDGAALLPIFGLFAAPGMYRVVLMTPILTDEDPAVTTQRVLSALEGTVRAEPDSWPWMSAPARIST